MAGKLGFTLEHKDKRTKTRTPLGLAPPPASPLQPLQQQMQPLQPMQQLQQSQPSLFQYAPFVMKDVAVQDFALWPGDGVQLDPYDFNTLTLSASGPATPMAGPATPMGTPMGQDDLMPGSLSDMVKICSVCGRNSKDCKVGHRLQSCPLSDHTDCALVCNCCEDFFRRQSRTSAPLPLCDEREACTKAKGGICRRHRFEKCIEVGMRLKADTVLSPAAAAAEEFSPDATPIKVDSELPTTVARWDQAINSYSDQPTILKALREALGVDESRDLSMLLDGPQCQFSDLLLTGDLGEDFSIIYHERTSVRALVQPFFAVNEQCFEDPSLLQEAQRKGILEVPCGLPPFFVANKRIEIGRDQIPVKLDSKRVPLDPITYTEMRDSVPRKVCVIERGESTKTPLYQRGKRKKAREVTFTVTSKCDKTTLYIRRAGTDRFEPVPFEQSAEVRDGDTLSIHNENSSMAELYAWRVSTIGSTRPSE